MTLSEFILAHLEPLLDDWTAFARTIPAARELEIEGLRDHAEAMLRAIAQDMRTAQSPAQQQRKSEGLGPRTQVADSAAEQHGSARRASGFGLVQMAAEFRALRATVMRQWLAVAPGAGSDAVQELVRFNEALDQALTESLARFVAELDEARELFLGVIAHDMRSPLAASLNAARSLKALPGLPPSAGTALDVVLRSHERLGGLTTDVLELVQARLHPAPGAALAPLELHALAAGVIEALRAGHPGAALTLECEGDTRGQWEAARLERLLSNLVENALKHGARGSPVVVRLRGEPDAVELAVWNAGPPIPAERLARLFEPMTTWSSRTRAGAPDGMKSYGLGLYIVREIVRAHAGTIRADSSETAGTTFTVRLPRCSPGARAGSALPL